MPAQFDVMPIWYHPIYTEGIHPDARFPRERYVELIKRLKSHRNSNQFLFLEPKKLEKEVSNWTWTHTMLITFSTEN